MIRFSAGLPVTFARPETAAQTRRPASQSKSGFLNLYTLRVLERIILCLGGEGLSCAW